MLVDYHVHVVAHGEYKYSWEWINKYLLQARQQGIEEVGFSEHDEFCSLTSCQLIEQLQKEWNGTITIRKGLEADYIPGRETEIIELMGKNAYDYIIGSIHFIDGWGFDHPDFRNGFEERDIDETYQRYTELLIQMAQTRLFDIVGHLDLIKIWGHRPRRQTSRHYFEPVLKTIKEYGLTVEINSAGLRKEVAEIYPALELIERMFQYSIPITFGSDAHHPEQIGEGLARAYQLARQAGYRYLVRFARRKGITTSI
jgi:histidinol-phosphatase (PHP family)